MDRAVVPPKNYGLHITKERKEKHFSERVEAQAEPGYE